MAPPQLETDRLILRQWRLDDLDDFARIMANPDVSRFLGEGRPMGRFEAWRALMMFAGAWRMLGYAHWVLESKATGAFIGRAGPWRPDGWPALEIGWAIDPQHQGKGYATEAGRAALECCWQDLGADRVVSLVRPGNAASVAVVRKLGGELVGTHELLGAAAELYEYSRP
ncbi:MAG: GNAT family N-acetyltransferase [Candidatus Dormibacteria bacterium]